MAAKKKTARKKKCPIMEPDPFSVWVSWEYTHCSGGGICAGEENDDWPSRETEYKDHEIHGVFSKDKKNHHGWSLYETSMTVPFEPVAGDIVYVVAAVYSDGDTFGSSQGNVTIVGVYTDEHEADKVAADIRSDDDNMGRWNPTKGYKERFTDYKSWDGYFNSLEYVEVHRFEVDVHEGVKRF